MTGGSTPDLYVSTQNVCSQDAETRISLPHLQTLSVLCSSLVGFVVFGDMLGASMRRGRAPADNSEVLAMFRLQYSGAAATQLLVDDAS